MVLRRGLEIFDRLFNCLLSLLGVLYGHRVYFGGISMLSTEKTLLPTLEY